MNLSLLLLVIILTASASPCLSTKNPTAVDLENTSDRSSSCICNAAPSLAQTPAQAPTTDTSMEPTPTSHPTIRNITYNTTLISNPKPGVTPSITNIITSVIFRIIITILSLLNTNFAWRIHAHHAQQRLRLARENVQLGRV